MIKKILGTVFGLVALISVNAHAVIVDLELSLLADVSGSVDAGEYNLQKQGYIAAFRNVNVINAILAGANGGIAVQYTEWGTSPYTPTPWFLINSAATSNAFADLLASLARSGGGNTGIARAIDFAVPQFNNAFEGTRQVIDISGDGTDNVSGQAAVVAARNNALAAGVDTINGITIGGGAGLASYYSANVIGGTNAFVIESATFAEFTTGIQRKLIAEITNRVSAPTTSILFLTTILGLGFLGSRRFNK